MREGQENDSAPREAEVTKAKIGKFAKKPAISKSQMMAKKENLGKVVRNCLKKKMREQESHQFALEF